MKITNFGRHEHRLLSAAIDKALKEVGDAHNVTLTAAGGHYGTLTGDIKLKVEVKVAAGQMTPAETEFRAYASYIGLKPEDFGKEFISNGRRFRITGLKIGAPKYNLLGEDIVSRKGYKFVADSIARQLRNAEKIAA